MFAILVLMALFTTFMTTPAVMAIYKPSRRLLRVDESSSSMPQKSNQTTNQRIIACINEPTDIPPLISLINSIKSPNQRPLKLYAMRLLELTDQPSSILMVQKTRKNGFPFIKRFSSDSYDDQVAAAFEAATHLNSPIKIRHSTSVPTLAAMHEDICHLAENKGVFYVVLVFGRRMEDCENGRRRVYKNVIDTAPCCVGVLVDSGIIDRPQEGTSDIDAGNIYKRVCVVFFGGPDDPRTMEVGCWMAENSAVSLH